MEAVEKWVDDNTSGYGSGSGSGDGYGSGDGRGSGSGSGYSSGDGSGDGRGYISDVNGKKIYMIDDVPTIITNIKDSVAKGYILKADLTLVPCYVVKGNGYFAHGSTLKKAIDSLHKKIFDSLDSAEKIKMFINIFEHGKTYPGTDFFDWHNRLTGSCLMGRETFVKNKGLDLNKLYTVDEFIAICEDDYGSEIIKQLKTEWNKFI